MGNFGFYVFLKTVEIFIYAVENSKGDLGFSKKQSKFNFLLTLLLIVKIFLFNNLKNFTLVLFRTSKLKFAQ